MTGWIKDYRQREAPVVEHPDYPCLAMEAQPGGPCERCVCGGIRHWHADPPYGCDDCLCEEFRPIGHATRTKGAPR